MSSTFTAPIRIFVRNNPTNDGTIAADNTGAAECTVQTALSAGVPVTVTIPAGSIISNVKGYFTHVGAGTSTDVDVDGETIGTLSDAAGVNSIAFGTGATAVGLLANVGTADVAVTFTPGGTAEGFLSVTYTPRNADGTITPYGSGHTNN